MRTIPLLSVAFLGFSLALTADPAAARPHSPLAADLTAEGSAATRMMPAKDLRLKPNEYRWYAGKLPTGPVEIVMSLSQQRAYAFRSGELLGVATISSGKEEKSSPQGRFQILEKKRMHRSIRYDNAPMPWMMRMNWHGVAMHAGHNPGYPASHGCFRLPAGFAQKLFAIADVGSFIYVTHDPLDTPEDALAAARANYTASMAEDRLPRGREVQDYAESGTRRDLDGTYAEEAPAAGPSRVGADRPARSLLHRLGGAF